MRQVSHPLIGAHFSATGGVHQALVEAKQSGATTLQLFTANQRRWHHRPLESQEIEKWQLLIAETQLQAIMSHASFLMNLAAPDAEILKKSRHALKEEIKRCLALSISYLNFHPGASLKDNVTLCLERIIASLLEIKPLLEKQNLILLLETTAGQGSCLGSSFEELAYIISRCEKEIPIGVCLDTCHVFAAGYDISSEKAWNATLKEFDKIVGLRYLYAFHLNDSLKPLGSRVDRHQPLGEGCIGLDCFKFLMQDQRTKDLPKYLETPGGVEKWKEEMNLLRKWQASEK